MPINIRKLVIRLDMVEFLQPVMDNENFTV